MAGGKILRAIILGAPGSGKGTISSRIVRDYKLQHLASGDLLRNQVLQKTEAGLKAEKYLKVGHLVPDDLIVKLITQELSVINRSWLLDGFPRTLGQAEALSKVEAINLVLNLDVPFDTIKSRLTLRWIHAPSGRVYNLDWNPPKKPGVDDQTGEPLIQREDDKPETVQRRLETYDAMTRPLLQYYKNLGVLKSFQGTESNVIYPKIQEFLTPWLEKFYKS